MKRLRDLRISKGFTQDDLAKLLKTTQQTIARWETGKAEPSLSGLRDLAMIFGTSADDLLGKNPLGRDKVTITTLTYFTKGLEDGYWGNVGILLPGQKNTKWYPITLSSRNDIGRALGDDKLRWIVCPTLNNRLLVVNLSKVRRIWFLDEASDQPDDWETEWDSIDGHPLEFYRALEEYHFDERSFRETASKTLISIVEDAIKEHNWNDDAIERLTLSTSIHTADGERFEYDVDPENLWSLVLDVDIADNFEDLPKIIRLDASGGDFESFYPCDYLSLVDMPLLKVMEAAKEGMEDEETDDAAQASATATPNGPSPNAGSVDRVPDSTQKATPVGKRRRPPTNHATPTADNNRARHSRSMQPETSGGDNGQVQGTTN